MNTVDNTFMARRQEQLDDEHGTDCVDYDDTDELVTRTGKGTYTFEIKDPEAVQEAMRMMLAGEIEPMYHSKEWNITLEEDK